LLTTTGTFRDHIKTEVLERQPASAYLKGRDSQFLRNIVGYFLEHRTVALYGAHDVLPAQINKIANVLVSVSSDTSPGQRSGWVRAVIDALVGSCKIQDICKLAYRPDDKSRVKVMSSSGRREALSVAVIMGKKDIVCTLAAEHIGCMWARASTVSTLGCALELVVQNGDLDLVEILLSHDQRSTAAKDMRVQTATVVRGITHTVSGNEPIALVLFEWYISNVHRKEIYNLTGWFEDACAFGKMQFLGKLVEASTPYIQEAFRKRFFRMVNLSSKPSGRYHHFSAQPFAILISFFLDAGLFDSSNINSRASKEHADGTRDDGLMDIVVWRGDLAVIRRVLDVGANADGGHPDARGMRHLLCRAVEQKRFDISKLLMEYGRHHF
jgi:hypothetical protein